MQTANSSRQTIARTCCPECRQLKTAEMHTGFALNALALTTHLQDGVGRSRRDGVVKVLQQTLQFLA